MSIKIKRNCGFTLAELLVVVAIIGILVAIAVPVFGVSLDSTKEATCAANRRSMKGMLTTAYMLDGKEGYQEEYDNDCAQFTCPSGGKITASLDEKTGVVTVVCSEHTVITTVSTHLDKLVKQSISQFFTSPSRTTLDSTGPNYGLKIKAALRTDLGIKGDFDFRVTRDNPDFPGEYLVFLCDSLSTYDVESSVGELVSVRGYRCSPDGTIIAEGTMQDIPLKTNKTKPIGTQEYVTHLVLDDTAYDWSTVE